MPRLLALVLTVALSACAAPVRTAVEPAAAAPAHDPAASVEALIDAVRARHGATWYRTLAFVQETTFHTPQGPRVQTWYEAGAVPGRLRIDVAPLGEGNTYLFTPDTTFIARAGTVVDRRPEGNPLMLLGFDIVVLPTAETVAGIAALGIDTGAVREDVWQGRPAVVVGGAPGDSLSPQVWFDRERLVFVRLVERDDATVTDIRFNEYRPLGGGWIAPHVAVYTDGRLVMEERYREVRADVDLPEGTFDTRTWPAVAWWTAVGYTGAE